MTVLLIHDIKHLVWLQHAHPSPSVCIDRSTTYQYNLSNCIDFWTYELHNLKRTWLLTCPYCCPDTSHTTTTSTGNGSPANNLKRQCVQDGLRMLTHLNAPFSSNPIPLL